jgi:hypothetical protein
MSKADGSGWRYQPDIQSRSIECRLFVYSGMAKPSDQEAMASEMIICYSWFPRGGHALPAGTTWGAPGLVPRQRKQGESVIFMRQDG